MRNKRQFKAAVGLGLAVPFLAFGLVFAEDTSTITNPEPDKALGEPDASKYRPMDPGVFQRRQEYLDKLKQGNGTSDPLKPRPMGEAGAAGGSDARRSEGAGQGMEKTRQERLENVRGIMQAQLRRAEHILERMDQIIARLESRRDKMDEAGIDVAKIDAAIAKVKGMKAGVQDDLDTAKEKYANLQDGEKTRETVQAFVTAMKDLKSSLMSLHQGFKGVIEAMRASMPERKERAEGAEDKETN